MKERTERIITTLEWMVAQLMWQHNQTGIGGDYSPELREAIALLAELKQGN